MKQRSNSLVSELKQFSISLRWASVEYERMIHAVPKDSLLSLSGRTCTCRWILLHSSVGFNHMICFCFLSSRCHGNLVYGCPKQQVKHRTPKQKENSPSPLNKNVLPPQFCATQEKQLAFKKRKKKCGGEIPHVHMHGHTHRRVAGSRDSQILTPHIYAHTQQLLWFMVWFITLEVLLNT